MTDASPPVEPADGPLPAALLALGFVLYAAVGGLSATFEILLIPLRIGSTLIPITIVLVVAGNVLLPRLSRNLNSATSGALPPIIGWMIVLSTFISSRPEGDVLLPGGGNVQYVSYGLMLAGMLAGVTSVLLSSRGLRGHP